LLDWRCQTRIIPVVATTLQKLVSSVGGLENLITVEEAAKLRGTGEAAVRSLARAGKLRSLRVPCEILFDRRDVENFSADKPGRKAGGM
jgi:excisionase family DNA binding protein